MKKLLPLLLITFLSISLAAQNSSHTRCYYDNMIEQLKKEDPEFENRRIQIEKDIQHWMKHNKGNRSEATYTIPVVFHVLYQTSGQNISDAQIQSQMNVLNADYRRYNSDSGSVPNAFIDRAEDTEIEFCYASRTPSGAPTNGIERKQTSVNNIGQTNAYYQTSSGGLDIWNRNKYLNIWVCEIGGGILGFATPPGSPQERDGVVVDHKYFGTIGTATAPFDKGRTVTHEVGHWFALEHIWGTSGGCSNDDGVSDTPQQSGPNYGCPNFPSVSCSVSSPNGDMFMNYMDYVNDACMTMFSDGQGQRMRSTINTSRSSLKTSDGCVGTIISADFTSNIKTVEAGNTVSFTDQSIGTPTGWSWTFDSGIPGVSIIQNPSNVLYNTIGSWNVQLDITDGSNNHFTLKTLYIDVIDAFPVGVDEKSANGTFKLFPNPTKGQFTLSADLMKKDDVSVKVLTLQGQQILAVSKNNLLNGNIQIDITNQPAGTYLLEITTSKGTQVKKIGISK